MGRAAGCSKGICPRSCCHVCVYLLFLTQRVFPTSSWCLLQGWAGDPPETLSGLTSNPLSLMW